MRHLKKQYSLREIIDKQGTLKDTFFNSFTQNQKHTILQVQTGETGRSMVEMLGVLAVIGVLSVGGIMGYRFAMDKYRANDIVNEVNLRSTDIWNRYQEMPLPDPSEDPDMSDFPEYAELTATGFPIDVTSHPDVAFRVHVYDVPSGVCKQVLNMNLENGITGLQYVQVNDVKYAGAAAICGENETDNEMIFTSFLDSELQSKDHCVEDADCPGCCGAAHCNEETLTCESRCTGDQHCLCNEDKTDGRCVECTEDSDCPKDEICDTVSGQYKCVRVPEKCQEGEFRAKNGACVPCSYMSSIIIMNSDDNDGIFEKEVAGQVIKDDTSGAAQCAACEGHSGIAHDVAEIQSGGTITTYCTTSCIKGVQYLSSSKGCIPCEIQEKNGKPQFNELSIPNDSQSLSLCTACPNRMWLRKGNGTNYTCVLKDCPEGYMKAEGICKLCNSNYSWPSNLDYYMPVIWQNGWYTSSAGNMTATWSDVCSRCPAPADGVRPPRRPVFTDNYLYYCAHLCGANQFSDFTGNCYPCDYEGSASLTTNGMHRSYLNNLCTACGRTVYNGYCVTGTGDCPDDEEGNKYIRSNSGVCVPCNSENNIIRIGSDQAAACEEKCGDTRYASQHYRNNDESQWRCAKKCQTGEYTNGSDGECYSCSDIGDGAVIGGSYSMAGEYGINLCEQCGDYEVRYFYQASPYFDGYRCVPKTCGAGKFKRVDGQCVACNSSQVSIQINSATYPTDQTYKEACEACDNRVLVGNYCVLYNPGVSGVCNNDGQSGFPDYPAGQGVKYRDNTGMCRTCSSRDDGFAATTEECNSCGGIRYLAGTQCVYGGCEDGETFMTSSGCKSCTTQDKTAIANTVEVKDICDRCGLRRSMMDGESAYCVKKCALEDEWQDINGNCYDGYTSTATNEIGTDETSQILCVRSGRKVTEDENGRVYCEAE